MGRGRSVGGMESSGRDPGEATRGNNQRTWGMELEPFQVWRTLKKPISAPRCLGSRRSDSSVWALAWNSRS